MLPQAFVTHQLDGRLRVRVPSKRRDAGYFDAVKDTLGSCEGVRALQVNPLTASVLVLHQTAVPSIASFAESKGLFSLVQDSDPPSEPVSYRISDRVTGLDRRVRSLTDGNLDLAGAAFVGLTIAGLFQLLRRNVWPPGFTLLFYAASVLPTGVIGRMRVGNPRPDIHA